MLWIIPEHFYTLNSNKADVSAVCPAKTAWVEGSQYANVYIKKGLDRAMLGVYASDGTASLYPVYWPNATATLQNLTESKLGTRNNAVSFATDGSNYRLKIDKNGSTSRGLTIVVYDVGAAIIGISMTT